VNTWREELQDVIKSKAERDAEEQERKRKRIVEALDVADAAISQALEGIRFAMAELEAKGQKPRLTEPPADVRFELLGLTVDLTLDRSNAVLRVTYNQGRPREFDFAQDRHLSTKDVEEYVGRRLVELARAAQKEHPW
jgi:hypothetical protein